MSDHLATVPSPASIATGDAATSRLADRLAALAPQRPTEFDRPGETGEPETQEIRPAGRRSALGIVVDSFVAACAFIPYALVGLALRLVMARLLFLDGQTRIEGPLVPLNVPNFDFTVVVPMQVKAESFTALVSQLAPLPVPPAIAAYLVSYGEFVLPILLVLGFATRFTALVLLIATALMQVYLVPDALWTLHVYWASILLVLLSQGAGSMSFDHLIRFITRR